MKVKWIILSKDPIRSAHFIGTHNFPMTDTWADDPEYTKLDRDIKGIKDKRVPWDKVIVLNIDDNTFQIFS